LNQQVYGIFCGGYHYSLKMYTYERVRARNFARTWGFVQCSQALPIAFGVPITGKFVFQSRINVLKLILGTNRDFLQRKIEKFIKI
jgi:hypothetical protein